MNRAQRRSKTQDKKVPRDFVIDYSWRMILSAVGVVLHAHGLSDDDICQTIVETQALIDAEVDGGGNAVTMIKRLEDETGIVLQRKEL